MSLKHADGTPYPNKPINLSTASPFSYLQVQSHTGHVTYITTELRVCIQDDVLSKSTSALKR